MSTDQITADTLPDAAQAEAQRIEAATRTGPRDAEGLVLFRLGSVLMAVPAARVEQIARGGLITILPRAPGHVLGITNLQRYPLPLLDIGRLLGIPSGLAAHHAEELDDALRTLVISVGEMRVGLVCQQVLGIVEADRSALVAPALPRNERFQAFVKAELESAHGVAAVLDLNLLLREVQS